MKQDLVSAILLIVLVITILINIFILLKKRKSKESQFHIRIKFAHGIKTKLVLNAEQYEKFQAFLNQVDGFFEIGDEQNHVKIYREFICAVEVKRK